MNLTDTYPGLPLRQVRTVALPVRKGTAADQNVRSWGIDDAREQRHDQIDDALFDAICEVIGEEDLPSSARADAGPSCRTLTQGGRAP